MKQYIDYSGDNLSEKANARYNGIIEECTKDHIRLIALFEDLLRSIEIPPKNVPGHDMMKAFKKLIESIMTALRSSIDAVNATHYISCTKGAIDNYQELREKCAEIMKDVHEKMAKIAKARKGDKHFECICGECKEGAKA